jgi:lipid A ethanolaminephosphotransferase
MSAHTDRGRLGWRPELGHEWLSLLVSLYLTVACNGALWRAFAAATDLSAAKGWMTAACFFVAITALQWLLLTALQTRWSAKPVLAGAIAVSAAAAYYMGRYTVYLDPDMVRNVLHTEPKESAELLTAGLWLHLLVFAGLPIAALWRVRIARVSWRRAVLRRIAVPGIALAVGVAAGGLAFQDLAALMRNHEDMRYLITPGNVVASLAAVVASDAADQGQPRKPVAADAHVVRVPGVRPKLLVIVVGETVRAQNWAMNGYARQITPELSRLDLLNFRDVTACGSSTEVSLPCMFSLRGRRDYDARDIKHSESLLHVLERAGIGTLWRDNQTGCKGVCDGLAFESFLHADDPAWCDGERCLDEIMLDGLFETLGPAAGDRVVVLHQLGNHGPSYYRRYPAPFRQFTPTCDTDDLGACSRDEIVNAYDNAVLHTDDFLARTIRVLAEQSGRDTAMIYLSDHGESLGENGLYLHGVPYAIAPDTQTRVPMVMWLSPGMASSRGIDQACMKRESAEPVSQDNLFHSVLGLMQVSTPEYDPALDLFRGCTSSG